MWTHESYVKIYRDEGMAEGLEKGREEGRRAGFENGIDVVIGAWLFLKENPAVRDEELIERFGLSPETVARVRSMMLD
jgi:predicted transposase YdaD